jgi:DNA replication and repair protein RecF
VTEPSVDVERVAPPLVLEVLSTTDFRNLAKGEHELSPAFNVFSGDNGQGKTNVLEAVYFLATSKSFRTSRLVELPAHGPRSRSFGGGSPRARTRASRPWG